QREDVFTNLLGFLIPSGKDQRLGLLDRSLRARIIGMVRTSRPYTAFVQQYPFLSGTTEDHRTQSSIPDRQCFDKLTSRLVIPQVQRRSSQRRLLVHQLLAIEGVTAIIKE